MYENFDRHIKAEIIAIFAYCDKMAREIINDPTLEQYDVCQGKKCERIKYVLSFSQSVENI